jgi:hypothetical protein
MLQCYSSTVKPFDCQRLTAQSNGWPCDHVNYVFQPEHGRSTDTCCHLLQQNSSREAAVGQSKEQLFFGLFCQHRVRQG